MARSRAAGSARSVEDHGCRRRRLVQSRRRFDPRGPRARAVAAAFPERSQAQSQRFSRAFQSLLLRRNRIGSPGAEEQAAALRTLADETGSAQGIDSQVPTRRSPYPTSRSSCAGLSPQLEPAQEQGSMLRRLVKVIAHGQHQQRRQRPVRCPSVALGWRANGTSAPCSTCSALTSLRSAGTSRKSNSPTRTTLPDKLTIKQTNSEDKR